MYKMHDQVGRKSVVLASLSAICKHLNDKSPEALQAISEWLATTDPVSIEAERAGLEKELSDLKDQVHGEDTRHDLHFVSRCDLGGLFQTVLAKVFNNIPDLQGYGDKNPAWVITLLEESTFGIGNFFKRLYIDVHGNHQPLVTSIIKEWKQVHFEKAPYPAGSPDTIAFSNNARVVLLADWGGDNPTAHKMAGVAVKLKPEYVIHLGDIYYGGVKEECDAFLSMWPLKNPDGSVPAGTSFALNGNHEMYSGGGAYFNTVLPAFSQKQPFFCMENEYWRIIGLDTAYNGGTLKPGDADSIQSQWDWFIALLTKTPKKATILLTHHQPVSAHDTEYRQSQQLRDDIGSLLQREDIGLEAIFGWFFGHEHRCAVYHDSQSVYNARLIENGCIPHEVQNEKTADPYCTQVSYFNKRSAPSAPNTAASMLVQLVFSNEKLQITYVDEDMGAWGYEVWDAQVGRTGGTKFTEYPTTT